MSGFGATGFEATGADAPAFFAVRAMSSYETLAVTEVSPGSGQVEARDLRSITITFDRPIDPFSLGFEDFQLVRTGDPNPLNPSWTESLDSSDPTNRRIVLTLDKPLLPGQYQLMMSRWSFLTGADGAPIGWGADPVIGSFDVVRSGPALGGAIDLGVPTSTTTVRPGRLDLLSDPNAEDVYKITLPEGQFWNLRLDVSAQADGGTLDPVVTLYDADGKRVASADQGSPNAPLDPRLVAGVSGGTYYVVVSGSETGNLPDGAYRLHVGADPIESITSVTSIQLDRANPSSSVPTGLTIRFSGPIDATALGRDKSQQGDTSHALYLVDAEGRTWPAIVTGYSPDRTVVSFVFQRELPAGTYRILTGDAGVLLNLAGRAPVAADQTLGVLGTITVAEKATIAPADLGTLWPGAGSSIDASSTIAPGETLVRTFTRIDQGKVSITISGELASLRLSIVDRDGNAVSGIMEDNPSAGPSGGGRWTYTLAAGTYSLILTNDGGSALPLSLQLRSMTSFSAALLDSGVGQSSAAPPLLLAPIQPANDPASLKSEAPAADDSIPAPIDANPSSPAMPRAPAYDTPSPASSADGLARAGSAGTPGNSTGSMILIGGVPSGRPSASFEMTSVVGPTTGMGTLALSSNHPGLPDGLIVVNQIRPAGPRHPTKDLRVVGEPIEPAQVGKATPPQAASDPNGTDAADGLALGEVGWLDSAIAWATGQDRGEVSQDHDPEPLGPGIHVVAPEAPAPFDPGQEPRIEFASMTTPAIIIASIVVAYRRFRARRSGGVTLGAQSRDSAGSRSRRLAPNCRAGARG